MVNDDVDTVGTALLLAAAPAGRGRAVDAASVLPALAAVPPGALTGTPVATVVELADPLDPQAVLTRLRAAAASPGPLAVYLAGQLQLDRRQHLPHLALARSTATTLRYTGLPWHWLAGELAVRRAGTTTVVTDLAADAELWERLGSAPGLLSLGPGVRLYGRVVPAPRRGAPTKPEYLRHFATVWRTGARPPLPDLHADAASALEPGPALYLTPQTGQAGVPVTLGVPAAPGGPPTETGVAPASVVSPASVVAPVAAVTRAPVVPPAAVVAPVAAVTSSPTVTPSLTVSSAAAVAPVAAVTSSPTVTPSPIVTPAPTVLPSPPVSPVGGGAPWLAVAPPLPAGGPVQTGAYAGAPGVPDVAPPRAADWTAGHDPDPHPAILAAARAGRHGEAVAVAVAWEQEALRRHGPRSREAVHWMEVRADLARLAGEPARSCELWIGAAQTRLGLSQGPQDPDVEGAVDRAHHQWERIADPARARALGPALVALRRRVPGRRAGALAALQRRMG
ncbi:hypothetical protein M5362_28940 [Streptomyces sp. Je 1-79]|uniref:hypothetical protein n=1 Tax=Streptomyces sp. Je 1-79 TaxID=2943847 RepID=UPI0021A78151|nr:hypothetical protein [Streptomyces sp. Je 1-79]MCT4357147.1 hypothetical protein [Streptomyces sp. Je 1-79]